jgi:hypothetical protein
LATVAYVGGLVLTAEAGYWLGRFHERSRRRLLRHRERRP